MTTSALSSTWIYSAFRIAVGSLAMLLVAASPSAAVGIAEPGLYRLLDHGNGSFGPAYGLRLDTLGKLFSVEENNAYVTLDWDGGTTATIVGFLNENTSGGAGGAGPIWSVNYTLTGIVDQGTTGFRATGGSGVLTDPMLNDTALGGVQNLQGWVFTFLAALCQ